MKIHSHERARVAHPRSGADATFGGFRGQQAGAVGLGRQGYVAGTPPQVDTWPWLLPLAPGLKCMSSGSSREVITANYGLPPYAPSVHPTGQPQLGFPPKKTMFISSGPWLRAPRSFVPVDVHTGRPPSPCNGRRGRGRRIGIRSIAHMRGLCVSTECCKTAVAIPLQASPTLGPWIIHSQ